MPWDKELSTELPPERPEEPAHLRRDILDELADHLDCALSRECRQTEDETVARKAVLARFGNPASLARQLWFDALKETLLKQRILLATNVLLAVVCIAVGVIAWTSLQQGRAFQQALLDKLNAAPPVQQGDSELSVWTHGSFKIVEDTEDGPPVVGYAISLKGAAFEPSKIVVQNAKTNEQGEVTFGSMRPSAYWLTVHEPGGKLLRREVVLYPGNKNMLTIVWPKIVETTRKPFRFDNVPEGLAEEDLILACRLTYFLPVLDSLGGEWLGYTESWLIRSDGYAAHDNGSQRLTAPRGNIFSEPSPKVFLRRSSYEYQSGLPFIDGARYEVRYIGYLFIRSPDSADESDEEMIAYERVRLLRSSMDYPEDQFDQADLAQDPLLIRVPDNDLFERVTREEAEAIPDSEENEDTEGNGS